MAFRKSVLHPSIADCVSSFLTPGELDVAVFTAFRGVEIAVRAAGEGIKAPEAPSSQTNVSSRTANSRAEAPSRMERLNPAFWRTRPKGAARVPPLP